MGWHHQLWLSLLSPHLCSAESVPTGDLARPSSTVEFKPHARTQTAFSFSPLSQHSGRSMSLWMVKSGMGAPVFKWSRHAAWRKNYLPTIMKMLYIGSLSVLRAICNLRKHLHHFLSFSPIFQLLVAGHFLLILRYLLSRNHIQRLAPRSIMRTSVWSHIFLRRMT